MAAYDFTFDTDSFPGIISASDPGAVGAGVLWSDISGAEPVLRIRDAANAGWIGVPGGGKLLASVVYAPATLDTSQVSSAGGPFDSVNLTIPFVAPDSGSVKVLCRGIFEQLSASEAPAVYLTDHTSGAIVGNLWRFNTAGTIISLPMEFSWKITGLTPGASLQYDLAGQTALNMLSVLSIGTLVYGSGLGGPTELEVYSA